MLLQARPGAAVIVAAVIDVVPGATEVAVTISPALTQAPDSFVSLTGTPDTIEANKFLRGDGSGRAIDWISASGVLSALLTGLANNRYPQVREAGGVRSLVGLTRAQLIQDLLTGIGSNVFVRANAAGDAITGAAGGLVRTWAHAKTDTQTAIGTGWTTGIEAQVTTQTGEAVVVMAGPYVELGSSGGAELTVGLRRDGVNLMESGDASVSPGYFPSMFYIDSPPAGTRTACRPSRPTRRPATSTSMAEDALLHCSRSCLARGKGGGQPDARQ